MSIILNALRKSEQERKALQPEQVATIPVQPIRTAASRKITRPMLLFGLVNLLIFAYLFFNQGQPVEPVITPMATLTPAIAHRDQPPPATITSTQPIITATAKTKAISDLWAENKKLQENAALKIAKPPLKKKAPITPAPKENSLFPEDPDAMNSAAADPTPATPTIDEAQAPEKAVDKPIVKTEHKGILLLRELAPDFQAKVPLSTINVLAYAEQPSNRFVIIDMVKYKIGQRIKGKINLVDILPDSVVLNFEGHAFRMERP